MSVDALIADNGMRQRDERFAEQDKYNALPDPLHDKSGKKNAKKKAAVYRPEDFRYDPTTQACICPAGKTLYGNGSGCVINGFAAIKFQGAQRDCVPCEQRDRCLRTPEKTKTRQVAFFQGKADGHETYTDKMKARIDSPEGRYDTADASPRWSRCWVMYGTTSGSTASPSGGERRWTAQWKLYCLVHNIEKLAHHGYAQ